MVPGLLGLSWHEFPREKRGHWSGGGVSMSLILGGAGSTGFFLPGPHKWISSTQTTWDSILPLCVVGPTSSSLKCDQLVRRLGVLFG